MRKVRVLLADDHQMVREGLRLLINAQRGLRVVGEASEGRQAVRLALSTKPDVVVMDLSMPVINGLQATALLQRQAPEIRVIALSIHEDETYLLQVCKAGAAGYVLKRSAAHELIEAIRTVAAGGRYYDAMLAGKALAGQMAHTAHSPLHAHELSARERQVLILLAWGCGNKEIANEIGVSVKTVETYKTRIGDKLGLRSRTEMVQYALRQGWMGETRPDKRASLVTPPSN